MSVKKAEAAYMEACSARAKAQHALEKKRDDLLDKARNQIDRDLKPEDDAVTALKLAEHAANHEWNLAKVASAHLKPCEHGPVGTRMVEWSTGRGYYSHRSWAKTGRTGKLAIWDEHSDYPTNTRYGHPSVGDYYVRVVKKDGTISRNFETLSDWKSKWLPEGVNPPGVK